MGVSKPAARTWFVMTNATPSFASRVRARRKDAADLRPGERAAKPALKVRAGRAMTIHSRIRRVYQQQLD